MKSRPEVVITGLGAVTPAGLNVDQSWSCLLRGERRVSTLEFNQGTRSCSYPVGQVKDFVSPEGFGGADRSVQFALGAAQEAIEQAGLAATDTYLQRAGCVLSLSKPAPATFSRLYQYYMRNSSLAGKDAISDTWPHTCCVQIANRYHLKGPRLCLPAACATGMHAVIRATGLILDGQADCVLAGAAEASLSPLYLAAFARMSVLANGRGDPPKACRPFDRRRSGLVPSEGAGVIVLESADSARRRGAKALAKVSSYWQGMHSLDLLKLEPDGHSLAMGIKQALLRSGLGPACLDYICAHGTGTVANDVSETAAIKTALGPAAGRLSISSHKGSIGHLLAAAGAIQVIFTVCGIQHNLVPPTVNLEDPDPLCDLDYTPGEARHRIINHALCITGGFGGQSGLIVLSKAG